GGTRVHFILRGAWQRHLTRYIPDIALLDVACLGVKLRILNNPLALNFLESLNRVQAKTILLVNHPVRIRTGYDLCTQVLQLFNGVDGDVTRTGYHADLVLQRRIADV